MRNRRQIIKASIATTALGALGARQVLATGRTPGRLSLGLAGLAYYNCACPFLNWYKMAGQHLVTLKNGAKLDGNAVFDNGYVDRVTGDIADPAPPDAAVYSRIFYAYGGPATALEKNVFADEHWTIKWEGKGLCSIGGVPAGSQLIDNSAGSGTFNFAQRQGNAWVQFKITDRNNPPRNIQIYQTRYGANFKAGDIFNPDWLAEIRNFGSLRLMGWTATNDSTITDFDQIADEKYFAWGQALSSASQYGPKGGMPLSIICKLANMIRCDIHFCIPHRATDSCVNSIAAYFKEHLDPGVVVTFEYSNECWNFVFQQASYCWSQGKSITGMQPASWYGYRSAQCMKIISDVYNDRPRWRGCLATQTVNPGVTKNSLLGVDYFMNHGTSGETFPVRALFDEISVTGYFGDVQGSKRLDKISKSNPAVVVSPSHGYKDGQRLKLFVATGMTELNDTFATVANATKDTFELAGVDARSFNASVTHDRNYAHPALVFELMDASAAKHASDPARFPSKYTYFNKILATSWLNGESDGFSTYVSVKSLKEQFWPAQKTIAEAYGLELHQYEGGLHFVGDIYLAGYGGNPQFTEYLVYIGHTQETAEVYTAMYAGFFEIGGHRPSKFVELGRPSPYGTWGGMRFLPGDATNPVWTAVRSANNG
jgi:hypothetical protein